MPQARIKGYNKTEDGTGDIILLAVPIDEQGRPIADSKDLELRLSEDALQTLIRENLPSEEQRIQEAFDQIHKIRMERGLNIKTVDKEIERLKDEAKIDFDKCQNKNEITRTAERFRVQISLISQKRYVMKFGAQEESELGLKLAKLRKEQTKEQTPEPQKEQSQPPA